MEYKRYQNGSGSLFCLGIKFPFEDGYESLYWNPANKSFQDTALGCWRDVNKEDELTAEFFRKMFLKGAK